MIGAIEIYLHALSWTKVFKFPSNPRALWPRFCLITGKRYWMLDVVLAKRGLNHGISVFFFPFFFRAD